MPLLKRIRDAVRPRVWWWIAGATLLHFAFWAAWFAIAARHSVAEVTLEATGPR